MSKLSSLSLFSLNIFINDVWLILNVLAGCPLGVYGFPIRSIFPLQIVMNATFVYPFHGTYLRRRRVDAGACNDDDFQSVTYTNISGVLDY